jgi:hypothetical protein
VLEDLISDFPYDIVQTPMIPFLIEHAKLTIPELIHSGEYQKAQKYENIHKSLAILAENRRIQEQKMSRKAFLEDQLAKLKAALDSSQHRFQQAMEIQAEKLEETLTEMQDSWDEETREFDLITSGPLPASARKFSCQLLNLREKEKFLIRSRRFEEADKYKRDADDLERKELIQLEIAFVRKRETIKAIKKDAFEQKVKCVKAKNERAKARIEHELGQEISNLKKSIANLKARILSCDNLEVEERSNRPITPLRSARRGDRLFLTQGVGSIGGRKTELVEVRGMRDDVFPRVIPSGSGDECGEIVDFS